MNSNSNSSRSDTNPDISNQSNTSTSNDCSYVCTYSCQLLFQIGFFIFGIVALAQDANNQCLKPLVPVVTIHVIMVGLNIFHIIWKIIKIHLNPLTRNRFYWVFTIYEAISFIWCFISWCLILHFFYVKDNNLSDCQDGQSLKIFILITFIFQSITLTFISTAFCCLGCLYCLLKVLGDDSNTNESGTEHLDRTQVYGFQSFMNFIGLDLSKEKCTICLENYVDSDDIRRMPCNHYFHQNCIDNWLKNNASCPICKQHIATAQSHYGTNVENIV